MKTSIPATTGANDIIQPTDTKYEKMLKFTASNSTFLQ